MRTRTWSGGLLAALMALFSGTPLAAQAAEHADGARDHDHLHFSHPLFTESPSPDRKLRIDYFRLDQGAAAADENTVRLEGEHAFSRGMSIEVNAPLTWRRDSLGDRATHLGTVSVALKLASFALAERGWLLGGGLEVGLPTGSDVLGIGSRHLIELEPFLDAGFKRGPVELVSIVSLSTTTNRRSGDEPEREFGVTLSSLYHVDDRIEALVEFASHRALAGEEKGRQPSVLSGGIKLRPFHSADAVLGLALAFPISDAREFDRNLIASMLYHF